MILQIRVADLKTATVQEQLKETPSLCCHSCLLRVLLNFYALLYHIALCDEASKLFGVQQKAQIHVSVFCILYPCLPCLFLNPYLLPLPSSEEHSLALSGTSMGCLAWHSQTCSSTVLSWNRQEGAFCGEPHQQ